MKNPPVIQETRVPFLGWEDSPGERSAKPTPVFLPEKKKKSHGQRSLSGYNGTRRSKEEQRSEGGLAFVTSVLVPGFLYGNS